MNIPLQLFLASIVFAPQAAPPQATSTTAVPALERIYKVGDEATYVVAVSDSSQVNHLGAKIHVKTLALLDGGNASQELTATDFSGGPDGTSGPAKVTWTFGKDGMAAANFNVQSPNSVYSLLSLLSVVGGKPTSGKAFRVNWTSPDKMSTITGTGSYEGTKELNGVKVSVVKTTLDVTPTGEQAATVHNTATFEAATGKLISSEGTVDVQGMQMNMSVKSA